MEEMIAHERDAARARIEALDWMAQVTRAITREAGEAGPAPDATGVDSDNDRLADADEAAVGTDPSTPDADGDGYYDGDEVNLGTDPLDPASIPKVSESPESA
jgi:Bacterial TSP3 repeat